MYDTNVGYNVKSREKPRTTKESSKCEYYRDKIISIVLLFQSEVGEKQAIVLHGRIRSCEKGIVGSINTA